MIAGINKIVVFQSLVAKLMEIDLHNTVAENCPKDIKQKLMISNNILSWDVKGKKCVVGCHRDQFYV